MKDNELIGYQMGEAVNSLLPPPSFDQIIHTENFAEKTGTAASIFIVLGGIVPICNLIKIADNLLENGYAVLASRVAFATSLSLLSAATGYLVEKGVENSLLEE